MRDPDAAFPGEEPAQSADGHDAGYAEKVFEGFGGGRGDVEDCREGGGAASAAGLAVAAVGAGEADVGAVAAAEEGGFDGGGGLGGGFAGVAAGVDGVVVDALGDEDLEPSDTCVCVCVCVCVVCGMAGVLSYQVCDAEVHGQRDDGGDQARPQRAEEVGHVADEPDGEEDEGDAICGARLVVLNQLGDLEGVVVSWSLSRASSDKLATCGRGTTWVAAASHALRDLDDCCVQCHVCSSAEQLLKQTQHEQPPCGSRGGEKTYQ